MRIRVKPESPSSRFRAEVRILRFTRTLPEAPYWARRAKIVAASGGTAQNGDNTHRSADAAIQVRTKDAAPCRHNALCRRSDRDDRVWQQWGRRHTWKSKWTGDFQDQMAAAWQGGRGRYIADHTKCHSERSDHDSGR